MQVAITRSFVNAIAKLGRVDASRARQFAEELVRDPEGFPREEELLHDAGDWKIVALRVSQGLRAIAQYEKDRITLLFTGHFDEAFHWARSVCTATRPNCGIRIPVGEIPRPSAYGLPSSELGGPWYVVVSDAYQLHQALHAASGTESGFL